MAPSTCGDTQKSPQTAIRRSSSTKHFSSGAIEVVGNAPPLPHPDENQRQIIDGSF